MEPRDRFIAAVGIVVAALVIVGPAAESAGAQVQPPVDGVVVDSFRPPAHVGAPGNRGWEYATPPGSEVRAVLPGVVVFAGQVGATRHVSVDHPGGLRTSYSFLATVRVRIGAVVGAGTVVGTTAGPFHFGLRRYGRYIDPAALFGPGPTGAPRLIPRPGRVPARSTRIRPAGGWWATTPLHSLLGPIPDQPTLSPRATHGRRVSGVGPGIR